MLNGKRGAAVAGAAVVGGLILWARGYADPPAVRGDVPPEVVTNALVARERMRQIVQAIAVWANDHQDQPPPTLSALYPTIIGDPLVFWHPGDSDSPPTTIDNDVPDAPNSSRISFYLDLGLWVHGGWCAGELPIIRDNSAANNGGLFVNEYVSYRWYTDPPDMMPEPPPQAVAAGTLRGLVMALHVYSNDNYDWWPPDPLLLRDLELPCGAARYFWHPGDDQPMPTQITNGALNALDSTQISFEYLVAGLNENHPDPNLAMFRDNSPANNEGFGVLTSYRDGHVEYAPLCRGDATGDLQVDFADFEHVAANLGRVYARLSQGDITADTNVDLQDVALLQVRFGVDCR